MKNTLPIKIFIPADIQRILAKIKTTWTKLTEREINYYLEGNRHQFLTVLQKKYSFDHDQAEMTLSCIERLA